MVIVQTFGFDRTEVLMCNLSNQAWDSIAGMVIFSIAAIVAGVVACYWIKHGGGWGDDGE